MKAASAIALAAFAALATYDSPATAQLVEIAAGATTGMAVETVFKEVNGAIDNARESGDYLLLSALVKAKDALDAWKQTNSELMDKAFSGVDAAARENFGRIRSLAADANDKAKDRLATASALGDQANQLVSSLPGGRPYISRFQPRIAPPTATSTYTIRINGVSLDEANPQLVVNGQPVPRSVIGPQEVQFTVPLSATPRNESKIQVYDLPVKYSQPKKGFVAWFAGSREEVSRQLPVVVMPATLARYEVEGQRKYDKREDDAKFVQNLGQFKGSNRRIYRTATPKPGWKWDVSDPKKFAWTAYPGSGSHGRCEGIDWNNASENGISVFARVDRLGPTLKYPQGRDGRVDCSLTGPVYRSVPTTEAIPAMAGTLNWSEDKLLTLPEQTSAIKATITTFDGRKRVFSTSDTDKFFELRVNGNTLTLVPKVPEDILAAK